jgi:hypothetical protein
VIIVLVLAILPFTNLYLNVNVNYSMWNLLLILFVLLTHPIPRRGHWQVAWLLAVVLLTWSHPLSVCLGPMLLVHLFITDGTRRRWLAVLGIWNMILYAVVGRLQGSPMSTAPVDIAKGVGLYLARVPTELLIGSPLTIKGISEGYWWLLAAAGAVMVAGVVALVLRRPRRHRLPILFACAVTVAMTVICFLSRVRVDWGVVLLAEPLVVRYFMLPRILLLTIVLSAALPWLRHCLAAKRHVTVAVVLIAFMTWEYYLYSTNFNSYRSNPYAARVCRNFLQVVQADLERAHAGEPYMPRHVLVRHSIWTITMDIDQHLGRSPETPAP